MHSELTPEQNRKRISRRWFLGLGAAAVLHIPIAAIVFNRGRKKVEAFSFSAPFSTGAQVHFDARDHERDIPVDPAFIQVGANDVAVWYFPIRGGGNRNDLTITLVVQNTKGRTLERRELPAETGWDEESAFNGMNVRFGVPAKALQDAGSLRIEFRYPPA